jgi:hypothetical protein
VPRTRIGPHANHSEHAYPLPTITKKPSLHNKNTNWGAFREQLKTQISLKIPLKTKAGLEDAIHNFTTVLQQAAW